jgi:hypothetical protein
MDVDHYNRAHPAEEQIPLILDITDAVEEMIIVEGIDDGAYPVVPG